MKILFLCTGNSCRSQMAEGLCRHFKPKHEVYSAGIEKHGLNPRAVKVMAEIGIDISGHESNIVEEIPVDKFDVVYTVCGHAHETCPMIPGAETIHQGFDDPPGLTKEMPSGTPEEEEEILAVYRRVRDQIKDFILVALP